MGSAAQTEDQASSIRILQPEDESRWDTFVESVPGGTFYHLSGWRRIFEEALQHKTWYLYSESGGEIRAVLPLVQVRSKLFGNTLTSMPFLVYGGVAAMDAGASELLVNEAVRIAESLGVDSLELRDRDLGGIECGGEHWVTKSSYVTFRKAVSSDPDENMRGVPRKQRAMIRKGIKAGLEAEEDDNAARLHRALLECKRNLGTPFFGRGYLQAIKDVFRDRAEILTITRNGTLVCSVMSFKFRDEILPYYGGGGDLARKFYGNDFMYWSVMERAAQAGVRIFDYGRSREGTGAYRFKKHWGFEPEPLHYRNRLIRATQMPSVDPSNPKYRLLISGWKRLPLPVAAILGPPLARRLG